MKIEDFKKVEDLYKNREKLSHGIKHLEGIDKDQAEKDRYWCFISRYSDGSGRVADLSGCGVLPEVVDATIKVLKTKLKNVEEDLTSLGVKL